MTLQKLPTPIHNTRIGLHYFPDATHYRDADLFAWLPELKSMGASWLVLTTPTDYAIPERFIKGLIDADIEPILHIPASLIDPPKIEDLEIILKTYARWGVHYVIPFDRPNIRSNWQSSTWSKGDIVAKFVEIFSEFGEAISDAGLIPVFPPLQPGGDYWDTAFLRASLETLIEDKNSKLIGNLVLSAYANSNVYPLNWGAGGPEVWPEARPYDTPTGCQNHLGFRIFDWYSTIAQAVLGRPVSIILLRAGRSIDHFDNPDRNVREREEQLTQILQISRLMMGEESPIVQLNTTPETRAHGEQTSDGEPLLPVSNHVLVSNFWVLATAHNSPLKHQAWFQSNGVTLPVVDAMRKLYLEIESTESTSIHETTSGIQNQSNATPIEHYLLLPSYEWGVADWHLDVIRDFIKEYRPTIGFSLDEAAYAQRVTVIGGAHTFSEDALNELRLNGAQVQRISGDGEDIVSELIAAIQG